MLVMHLVPDGVRAFHAFLYDILYAHIVEGLLYGRGKQVEEFMARRLCGGELFLYCSILVRVFVFEAQVFKFGLYFVKSEAIGQWGVEIECLSGNLILFACGLACQGAHIMESVAYFDEDDTYVVAHGEQQFLEVLCLCRCLFAEDSTADFCQSVNDLRYFCAEDVFDVFGSIVGVFHHIVQQGCTDAGRT